MQTIMEDGQWRVTCRINKSNNLTLEIERDGKPHAEVILQEGGVIDLGTMARPWPLGEKGWEMPGAPSADLRKYRFGSPRMRRRRTSTHLMSEAVIRTEGPNPDTLLNRLDHHAAPAAPLVDACLRNLLLRCPLAFDPHEHRISQRKHGANSFALL